MTFSLFLRGIKMNLKSMGILAGVSLACAIFLGLATSQESFETYRDAMPIAFAMACAAIFVGLNMSINMICKDYEMIRRELRMGVSAKSLIAAKMLLIVCLCFLMSLILIFQYLGNWFNITGQNAGHIFAGVFFTMLTAAACGLAISVCVRGKTQKAAQLSPIVMIIQILFSGFVFGQIPVNFSHFTFSNYAIRIIGSGMRFDNENFVWGLRDGVREAGLPMTPPGAFGSTAAHVANNLVPLVFFTLAAVGVGIFALYRFDRKGSDRLDI